MVAPSTYKMFIREKYFTITKLGRGQWGTGVAEQGKTLKKAKTKNQNKVLNNPVSNHYKKKFSFLVNQVILHTIYRIL